MRRAVRVTACIATPTPLAAVSTTPSIPAGQGTLKRRTTHIRRQGFCSLQNQRLAALLQPGARIPRFTQRQRGSLGIKGL